MDKKSIFDSVMTKRVQARDIKLLASTENKKEILEYQIYLQKLQLDALTLELAQLNEMIESKEKETTDELKRN